MINILATEDLGSCRRGKILWFFKKLWEGKQDVMIDCEPVGMIEGIETRECRMLLWIDP